MIRLAETGRAISLVGQLSLCARLIHSALKREDLEEEDRATLQELNRQRAAYSVLIREARAQSRSDLGQFDKVLESIEEFCGIVQEGIGLSSVQNHEDAAAALVMRLQDCASRLEQASLNKQYSKDDIETIKGLQAQRAIYQKTLTQHPFIDWDEGADTSGVTQAIESFCALIDSGFPLHSAGGAA